MQVRELVEQAAVPGPLHAYVVLELVRVQLPVRVICPPEAVLEGVAVSVQLGVGGNTLTKVVAGVDVKPGPLLAVTVYG